jgi:hypothetical protein
MSTILRKQISALTFFSFLDKSSEESKQQGKKLPITSKNWNEKKEHFIEGRFSQREHEAWNLSQWAKQELEYLNSLEFEESDRKVLKDSYSRELSKIIKGRMKGGEQELSFKWKAEEKRLKLLYDKLKEGRYIQCTFKEFELLFKGQEASSIKPIQWKATQWELGFFINYLFKEKLKLIAKCNHIKIACLLFISKNGQPFKEASLKSQMSEARKGIAGSAAKQEKLEELINLCALG